MRTKIKPEINVTTHRRHFFSDLEFFDKEFDGAALEEDGEPDHEEGGGDKEVLVGVGLFVEDLDQGEADGAAEAAVGEDELLLPRDLLDPGRVEGRRQQVDAGEPDHGAEEARPQDEPSLPHVRVPHRRLSQKQENHSVAEA